MVVERTHARKTYHRGTGRVPESCFGSEEGMAIL